MLHRTTLILLFLSACLINTSGQTTYIVNSTNDADDGTCDAIHCSLREAINASNSDATPSTIEFGIGTGMQETIFLDDALPFLTEDSTVIDGMTQTGIPGGVRLDCGNIGAQQQDIIRIHGNYCEIYGLEIFNYTVSETPMVIGAGSLIGIGGIFILVSPNTIKIGAPGRGNILHSVYRTRSTAANYGNGIAVHSGTEIIIQGNRIGTNYATDTPLEVYGEGIRIDENNFGETQIGGTGFDEGNIIGNCLNGIGIYGGDGWMYANHIGVARDLTTNHGNRNAGIFIRDGQFYEVGGTQANEGNFCFFNQNGIEIRSLASIYVGNNTCANNDPSLNGIYTAECPDCIFEFNECYNNGTGIRADDLGNTRVLIRYNEVYDNVNDGVQTTLDATSTDMTITQNVHYCNGMGIGVGIRSGASPFDPIMINSVSATQVIGLATPGALIEVFEHDTTGCPNAICQGKVYFGSTTADGTGLWIYNDMFTPGGVYTMTQTLVNKNTSPFGPCFTIPECTTIVTTPADSGPGSLREAILCANANPGPDTIAFNIMGGIPRTISLVTPLPSLIDDATIIDGTTQPGNLPMNSQITIDCGNLIGLGVTGLRIEGDNCQIFGLNIINSQGSGIIAGRDIDPINGLVIGSPDKFNIIRDVVRTGATIYAGDSVIVQSNYFGSDVSFSPPFIAPEVGCLILATSNTALTLIGGSRLNDEGNVFVYNSLSGLEISGQGGGSALLVRGNFFGTDKAETIAAGNGLNAVASGALTTANHNVEIGHAIDDFSNVFAHNFSSGIYGILGEHLIVKNSFYCNDNGGIDHSSNAQMGNPQSPTPIITDANSNTISGTASGSGAIQVYFHGDDRCNNAPCQGKIYLGQTSVDPTSGIWTLNGPFPIALNIADEVTATYTTSGQTSEFSPCVQVCPDLLITVSNDGPYCEGDTVRISTTVNSSSTSQTYNWSGPNNYSSNDPNPTGLLDSGLYILNLTVDGCDYPPQMTRVVIFNKDTTNIDRALCTNEFLIVGGERFDSSRTSGSVTMQNSFGCDSIVEVSIDLVQAEFTLINDTLCFEGEMVINNKLYNRNNPSGMDTFTRANSCDSFLIVDLSFRSNQGDTLDQTLCTGDTLRINGKIYDENNPSGVDTLTNRFGCDSIIHVDLKFGSATIENIDTTLCPGDELIVNNIVYDQFYMAGSDTLANGSFRGCDSIINVVIRYPDPIFDLDTISPSCDGTTKGQVIIQGISGIPGPYKYSLNGSPARDIQNLPWTISDLDEGDYDLIFTDNKGCNYLQQLSLNILGSIDFQVVSPINIDLGDSTDLDFSAGFIPDSVLWFSNGVLICRGCDFITVKPSVDTRYQVTLFKDGCQSTMEILVTVDDNTDFYVPNVFSPDGDNINDLFNVFSSNENAIITTLQVYDRWGEMIYFGQNLQASNTDEGWDGTFNGENVPSGVYVFRAVVDLSGGRIENLVGEITVIR